MKESYWRTEFLEYMIESNTVTLTSEKFFKIINSKYKNYIS
jgi:hypothetical protein